MKILFNNGIFFSPNTHYIAIYKTIRVHDSLNHMTILSRLWKPYPLIVVVTYNKLRMSQILESFSHSETCELHMCLSGLMLLLTLLNKREQVIC